MKLNGWCHSTLFLTWTGPTLRKCGTPWKPRKRNIYIPWTSFYNIPTSSPTCEQSCWPGWLRYEWCPSLISFCSMSGLNLLCEFLCSILWRVCCVMDAVLQVPYVEEFHVCVNHIRCRCSVCYLPRRQRLHPIRTKTESPKHVLEIHGADPTMYWS